MGSRSRRKKRDRLAAVIDPMGSMKPKAVAMPPQQALVRGDWGRTESGLAPTEELNLVAKSFGWLKGQRFPTNMPVDQIKASAQAEHRKLTAPEVVVLTAAGFLDRSHEKPETFRQGLRQLRRAAMAAKLVIQAELMNQAIDHNP